MTLRVFALSARVPYVHGIPLSRMDTGPRSGYSVLTSGRSALVHCDRRATPEPCDQALMQHLTKCAQRRSFSASVQVSCIYALQFSASSASPRVSRNPTLLHKALDTARAVPAGSPIAVVGGLDPPPHVLTAALAGHLRRPKRLVQTNKGPEGRRHRARPERGAGRLLLADLARTGTMIGDPAPG
jgi:hypothetical protein